MEPNRTLDQFFGEYPTRRFWEALTATEVHGDTNGVIDLDRFKRSDLPAFARSLVKACEILITAGDGVLRGPYDQADMFAENSRREFLNSRYHEVHEALFELSDRFPYVWVEGKRSYGVRVAHITPKGSVSLVTGLISMDMAVSGLGCTVRESQSDCGVSMVAITLPHGLWAALEHDNSRGSACAVRSTTEGSGLWPPAVVAAPSAQGSYSFS